MNLARNSTCNMKQSGTKTWRFGCVHCVIFGYHGFETALSDNAFAFYSSFCKCAKRGRKIRRKETKKLSQFLKSHISGIPDEISLKFGMWSTEVGGNVHSKICLVLSRQHRATEVRKLRFLSSCQYTHGVARRLLGPHDTLPCVLIKLAVYNTSWTVVSCIHA